MSEFRQIKASAGSGKTYTLTSTFLSLLAGSSGASWSRPPSGCTLTGEESYGWQEILAITFTNKAAAEMRERLLQRLKGLALTPKKEAKDPFWKPAKAREAVDMLIRSYGSLNIRTIDSLLHLMVRLSALDFDLSPDFEPRFSDEEITGPLFDDMAEQARTDEELGAVFRRACRQMLRSEKTRGFLAGDRIRERVTAMVSLMLAADGWSIRDLASPEEAEEHFQQVLRSIQNDALEMRARLEQEDLKASKHFLNALMQLPVLHGTNQLCGAAVGFLEAVFYLWIILIAISFTLTSDFSQAVLQQINESSFLLWLYRNNFLLQLLAGVFGGL